MMFLDRCKPGLVRVGGPHRQVRERVHLGDSGDRGSRAGGQIARNLRVAAVGAPPLRCDRGLGKRSTQSGERQGENKVKLTTRVMRVVLVGVSVAGLTGLGSGAYAAPAGDISDGGIIEDDPATAGTDEGAAIDCDALVGRALNTKTDAGAGYGYNVSTLSVSAIARVSGGTCTTIQPNVAKGTATAVGDMDLMWGMLQSPASDCTSDTVEAILNSFGAGKTIGGDEYPASGKITIQYTGTNSLSGTPFQSTVVVRSTTGTSALGDTLSLTGIVMKGAAQGGVYTSEIGFLPSTVSDTAPAGNGNGYYDTNFAATFATWAAAPYLPIPWMIRTGEKVDTNYDSVRDVYYDKDGDGYAGDSFVGALEGASPTTAPENLVTDTCIRYTNIGGTAGTSLMDFYGTGGGAATVTGGTNLPTGQGDAITGVNFFTDGTLASGSVLNSSVHISFQP